MKYITSTFDYLKNVPIAFLISFGFLVGIIIFIPTTVSNSLGIEEFRVKYKIFLGPLFLFIITFIFARLIDFGLSNLAKRRNMKEMQKMLHALTPEEQDCLKPYISERKNTLYIAIQDGVMGGLLAKKITYPSSNVFDPHRRPYNLNPWAREYLEKHPELLNSAVK